MAVTQNLYTGNGSTVLYSFTFPYLETTDIKVSVNGTNTTAYTLANATTIQFNTAPVNGAAIRIYRQTDDTALPATFYSGSAIRANDLNENFTQNLYVTQESTNNAASATSTANTALTNSNTAISTANTALSQSTTALSNSSTALSQSNTAISNSATALSQSNTAISDSASAVSTAATASSNASTALSQSNTALSNSSTALSQSTTALSNSTTAVSTASSAVSTANTALSTANAAQSTANTADANANAALNAIAGTVQYVLVANVAAIPGSPANGDAIEIADSTGIESFSPLTNRPAGFVGDSGLSVRLQYLSAGSSWNWLNYFPNNAETRYLKLAGGTLTGQLRADDSTSVASPVIAFDGDTNTGIAHTGADELALVTGGTARVTIDPSGNVAVSGGLTKGGNNVVTVGDSGTVTSTMIADGTIVNSDVNASAAIAGTKISPDFGSQNVTTTGTVTGASLNPTSSTVPTNGVYLPAANSVAISTGGSGRLFVDASGNVGVGATPSYALDVTRGSGNGIAARFRNTGGAAGYVYTSGTDTVYFTGDTAGNNSIGFNSTNNYVSIFSGSSGIERIRVTSAGLVGVGTSTVGAQLEVLRTSTTDPSLRLRYNATSYYGDHLMDGNGNYIIYSPAANGVTSGNLRLRAGGSFSVSTNDQVATSPALTIDTSGRLGIGSTTVGAKLDVVESFATSALLVRHSGTTGGGAAINVTNGVTSTTPVYGFYYNGTTGIGNPAANTISAIIDGSERARIDSSGRLLVGTSSAPSAGDGQYSRIVAQGYTGLATGHGYMSLARGQAAASISSGDEIGTLAFTDSAGYSFARISCTADAPAGSNDYPGRLVFSTTSDSASSPTERVRINAAGAFKQSVNGSYRSATGSYSEFRQTDGSTSVLYVDMQSNSADNVMLMVNCLRSAASAYSFIQTRSGDMADVEHNLRGDGNGLCDGSWTGGGADYAEYFEWADGNPDAEDRRGISVVLDGGKIREAAEGEDPIGVISGNPSVVGDSAWNKWSGKYMRDDFGSYLLDENGHRQLAPAFDPDQEYIPREERPEWDCVGLMGKLRIRKGQATGSRWIKMRDISDSVEEWLVR